MTSRHRGRLALLLLAALAPACGREPAEPLPPGDYTPRKTERTLEVPPGELPRVRAEALKRAKVWRPPPVAIGSADLSRNPPGPDALPATAVVPCKFQLKSSEG